MTAIALRRITDAITSHRILVSRTFAVAFFAVVIIVALRLHCAPPVLSNVEGLRANGCPSA